MDTGLLPVWYLSAVSDVDASLLQVSLTGSESQSSFSLGETQIHQLSHFLRVHTQAAVQRFHLTNDNNIRL